MSHPRDPRFSGADGDRRGVFQAASGSTLFLDELGELPPHHVDAREPGRPANALA